jgi:hypothetical protein
MKSGAVFASDPTLAASAAACSLPLHLCRPAVIDRAADRRYQGTQAIAKITILPR